MPSLSSNVSSCGGGTRNAISSGKDQFMPYLPLNLTWRTVGLLCGLAAAIVSAGAQPVINPNGIVNSASYLAPGLPGSGIAQGSIFTISGKGLGPANAAAAPGVFPLPTALEGTSVAITDSGAASNAVILYTSDRQVAAILPSTVPAGNAKVTVTFNGEPSAPVAIQVVTSGFGIFTFNQGGFGQAVASDTAYRANTIVHTFHPGDLVILWGTGIGPIKSSDSGLPPTGNLAAAQVYVGNTTATVHYHGRSGCCAGVDQIVFEVPAGVEGCYVPIGVQAGGVMSNIATIAVSNTGETCSDSILGSDLIGPGYQRWLHPPGGGTGRRRGLRNIQRVHSGERGPGTIWRLAGILHGLSKRDTVMRIWAQRFQSGANRRRTCAHNRRIRPDRHDPKFRRWRLLRPTQR
jgi:uncharacterized protein (TIGR03437 family)